LRRGAHARAIKDDAECIRYMHAAIDEGITLFIAQDIYLQLTVDHQAFSSGG